MKKYMVLLLLMQGFVVQGVFCGEAAKLGGKYVSFKHGGKFLKVVKVADSTRYAAGKKTKPVEKFRLKAVGKKKSDKACMFKILYHKETKGEKREYVGLKSELNGHLVRSYLESTWREKRLAPYEVAVDGTKWDNGAKWLVKKKDGKIYLKNMLTGGFLTFPTKEISVATNDWAECYLAKANCTAKKYPKSYRIFSKEGTAWTTDASGDKFKLAKADEKEARKIKARNFFKVAGKVAVETAKAFAILEAIKERDITKLGFVALFVRPDWTPANLEEIKGELVEAGGYDPTFLPAEQKAEAALSVEFSNTDNVSVADLNKFKNKKVKIIDVKSDKEWYVVERRKGLRKVFEVILKPKGQGSKLKLMVHPVNGDHWVILQSEKAKGRNLQCTEKVGLRNAKGDVQFENKNTSPWERLEAAGESIDKLKFRSHQLGMYLRFTPQGTLRARSDAKAAAKFKLKLAK